MKDKLIKDLTKHLVNSILNESEGVDEVKINTPSLLYDGEGKIDKNKLKSYLLNKYKNIGVKPAIIDYFLESWFDEYAYDQDDHERKVGQDPKEDLYYIGLDFLAFLEIKYPEIWAKFHELNEIKINNPIPSIDEFLKILNELTDREKLQKVFDLIDNEYGGFPIGPTRDFLLRLEKEGKLGKFYHQVKDIIKKNINEVIVHQGSNYIVKSKDKSKTLGTHKTKEDALKQLRAIEINKHKTNEIKINDPKVYPNPEIDWYETKGEFLQGEDGYKSYIAYGKDQYDREWLGTAYYYGDDFDEIKDPELVNEVRINNPQKYKVIHKEGKDYIIINGKEYWGEWYVSSDDAKIEFGVKLPIGKENLLPKKWMDKAEVFYIPEENTINTLREISKSQNLQENQFPKSDNFKKFVNYLNELVNYVCEDLQITRPQIKLINNTNYSQENHSFGGYQPGADSVYLVIKNRNCRDVCVTLAHELRHHWQHLNNKIKPGDGKDGDEIENDAQSYAGMVLRKFGRENPEIFELLN